MCILSYILGNSNFNDEDIDIADYNQDLDVNILDILLIAEYIAS